MTDSTAPEMEQDTIETWHDGELVETRTVAVPKAPPKAAELEARIDELESRITSAASASAAIDPDATTTPPKTKAQLATIKSALTEMAPDEEEV